MPYGRLVVRLAVMSGEGKQMRQHQVIIRSISCDKEDARDEYKKFLEMNQHLKGNTYARFEVMPEHISEHEID